MTDFGVNQPALVKPVDLVGHGLIRADPALKLRHMTKDHVGVSRRLENPGRVTLSALYCSFEIKQGGRQIGKKLIEFFPATPSSQSLTV